MPLKQSSPRFVRLAEAITYTSLSRSTIYRALRSGQLQAKKLGGRLMFELEELDRWIDEHAQIATLN